jgi:hypothetical protein
MGVRGELFSSRVILPNRTYFFNVKENRMGDIYLNIVESKNKETGGFDRQSVILFSDDLQEFLKGFDESLQVLEKAVRDKRRSKPSDFSQRSGDNRREETNNSADKSRRYARQPRQHQSAHERHGRTAGKPKNAGSYAAKTESYAAKTGGFAAKHGREKTFNKKRKPDQRQDSGRDKNNRVIVRRRENRQ